MAPFVSGGDSIQFLREDSRRYSHAARRAGERPVQIGIQCSAAQPLSHFARLQRGHRDATQVGRRTAAGRRSKVHSLPRGHFGGFAQDDSPPPDHRVAGERRSPGSDIEDAPDQFFTHRQVELGKQSARAQLIWLPNSISYEAIAYEQHREFLQSLENAKRDSSGYRFIREPLTPDAVIREILAWRQRHEEELAPKNIPSAAVLDAHFQDLSNAIESLGPRLEKRKVALEINYGEDEPRKNIGNLMDKLKKASRLIMVFGRWKREQFEFRLREALKMCLEEEGRLKPCGIYFAPPHSLSADQR